MNYNSLFFKNSDKNVRKNKNQTYENDIPSSSINKIRKRGSATRTNGC